MLTLLASHQPASPDQGDALTFRIDFPKFPGRFTGTGDLFAALLLAHIGRGCSLPRACEQAVAIIHGVLKSTLAYEERVLAAGSKRGEADIPVMRRRELRIVECRDLIATGAADPVPFPAVPL